MSGNYVGWYGKPRRQDWQTPYDLFKALDQEYHFTLDGAAEDHNALLALASTPERPIGWAGHRVFCNPPWSAIAPFIEQAATADLAVLLVPARTNAKWFHRALALGAYVRYFLGRPSFRQKHHNGPGHNSPVDCLLLVFKMRDAKKIVSPAPAPAAGLREAAEACLTDFIWAHGSDFDRTEFPGAGRLAALLDSDGLA